MCKSPPSSGADGNPSPGSKAIRQPHRDISSDLLFLCRSDAHMGARWTSLSGAMSEWAELYEAMVKDVSKTEIGVFQSTVTFTSQNKVHFISNTHLVNSNSASTRGWWTMILFFSIRAV